MSPKYSKEQNKSVYLAMGQNISVSKSQVAVKTTQISKVIKRSQNKKIFP